MNDIVMGDKKLSALVDGRCPDCDGIEFLRGPEGGLCINDRTVAIPMVYGNRNFDCLITIDRVTGLYTVNCGE